MSPTGEGHPWPAATEPSRTPLAVSSKVEEMNGESARRAVPVLLEGLSREGAPPPAEMATTADEGATSRQPLAAALPPRRRVPLAVSGTGIPCPFVWRRRMCTSLPGGGPCRTWTMTPRGKRSHAMGRAASYTQPSTAGKMAALYRRGTAGRIGRLGQRTVDEWVPRNGTRAYLPTCTTADPICYFFHATCDIASLLLTAGGRVCVTHQ